MIYNMCKNNLLVKQIIHIFVRNNLKLITMKRILLTTLCLLGLLTIVNAQETTFSFNFNNNTFDG